MTAKRIYVASSWRNERYSEIVKALQRAGHEVNDFRNPPCGSGGFQWEDVDPDFESWTTAEYKERLLKSPIVSHGFLSDMRALVWCDTCVLVMPCGSSAHLELGWCAGAGKRTIVFLGEGRPELMYLLADSLAVDEDELLREISL